MPGQTQVAVTWEAPMQAIRIKDALGTVSWCLFQPLFCGDGLHHGWGGFDLAWCVVCCVLDAHYLRNRDVGYGKK